MCLVLTTNKKLNVAKEDIKVWKIISLYGQSAHRSFNYDPNVLYRLRKPLKTKRDNVNKRTVVEEGFHSYRYRPLSTNETFYKIVEFTIPKGAKYYEGGDNSEFGKSAFVSTSIRSGNLEAL